jgi:mono/diheme cytochrome c family protein
MPLSNLPFRARSILCVVALTGAVFSGRFLRAQAPESAAKALVGPFEQDVKPFLTKNCLACHNADTPQAGVRVDNLDATLEDRQIRFWEGIRHRVANGTMPPKGMPQPGAEERKRVTAWITQGLEVARLRPAPKNGLVRRLTVAQYRNTLRELLKIDDDFTEILPPDAVSKDGFINNTDSLHLSPLLIEAYLEIAEDALGRAIVDPKSKPKIQNFRVDLGASVNPDPYPAPLILGANSLLLENTDVLVTQLTPKKPFAFEPFFMRTKYRFIEGYQGNDTVRGWRDFDSIYHSVFACLRGSRGYPKGLAYTTVPGGLLLRPAIPNEEMFDEDGTYGPKANFKISLRELPDQGRFRVTVMAAKYDDGLMLDKGAPAREGGTSITASDPKSGSTVMIPSAGIYQADIHAAAKIRPPSKPDSSRLGEGLSGSWPLDGAPAGGRLDGDAKFVDSPFGKALSLEGDGGAAILPRGEAMNVGEGDFTVAAWVHPSELGRAGIVALGAYNWSHGWYLDMPDNKGDLRLETSGPDTQPNGEITSPPGVIRKDAWQHVAAVVRRGAQESYLYVNGYQVAKGQIGRANLDNPKMDLYLGRIPGSARFRGQIDEVRIYRRALSEAEIQGLIEPGRRFATPPPEKPQPLTLKLGNREFSGLFEQAAFAVVRLPAGPLAVSVKHNGLRGIEGVVLTAADPGSEIARKFAVFEKRSPKLGVQLGLRRDCGSTFAPAGAPRTVAGTALTKFVFEGAIRNHPSPDVEKDNVNYLAGIREIAVRSEFTDGRDMPRLLIRSIEFEGPFHDTWPPRSHTNIFVSANPAEVIRSFATRAYRRPVEAGEAAALMAVYEKSAKAGRGFEQSVKDALQVALTSPQFLFLTERSNTPAPEPLDDHELASKLSYFLWNGPPDRATLRLAGAGSLRTHLDSEVDRMIADPRFSQFVREFAVQWLSLDKFHVLEPDRKRFPRLTRDVRTHLRLEPVHFVEHLMRNNLPVRNLISSDFVLADEAVASYYGFGEKVESGFRFQAVPHGRRELGGVLTQPAITAGLSDGRESNPVKRGAWLARKIVAEPPSDPPPNVPALKEDPAATLTLRERIEQHRNQTGCQQCHMKIDPWGVALEEFDASGRLKEHKSDARSKLPDGTEVDGIDGLRRYLADDRIDQVAFSVLKHLTTYATGRTLTYNELDYLKRDGRKLRADGYRMKDMLHYVVNSRMFLEK